MGSFDRPSFIGERPALATRGSVHPRNRKGDPVIRRRALPVLVGCLLVAMVAAPPVAISRTAQSSAKRLTVHGMSHGTHVDVGHLPRYGGGHTRHVQPTLRRDRGKRVSDTASTTRPSSAKPAPQAISRSGAVSAARKTPSSVARVSAPEPAPAAAIPPTSILVLDSDPGDYIGQGLYQTFPSAISTITTSTLGGPTLATPNEVQVNFFPNPAAATWWWDTDFAAPPGQALAVGTYSGAVRTVSRASGQPGLDIYGSGRGCSSVAGSFTVEELSVDASGNLLSFAATFVQYCEGQTPALTGEVRFDSSVGWSEKQFSPSSLSFGTVAVGSATPGQTVTVTSIGTDPLVISKGSFTTAPIPSSFTITGGSCVSASTDVTLAPMASCTFTVNTDTSKVITPTATVRFADDTARGAGNEPVSATFTGTATVAVTMASPASGEGGGTVTSSPTGLSCTRASGYVGYITGTCSSDFVPATTVTLTATPDAHSIFTGWSGPACPGTGTCAFTPSAGITTVTADFESATVGVSLASPVAGLVLGTVTSSPGGISCGTFGSGGACQANFAPNAQVTLTAMPTPDSVFVGWSGVACPGTGACSFTPPLGTTSVTALFETATVAAAFSGVGAGVVTSTASSSPPWGLNCYSPGAGSCQAGFLPSSTVTLTATPDAHSVFTGWSGAACPGTGTCVLTPAAGITTVTADFETAKISLTASGSGAGHVISSPSGIDCTYSNGVCNGAPSFEFFPGSTVNLTATPAAGSIFAGWGGPCSGTGTTCSFKPSAGSIDVQARFEIAGPAVGTFTGTPPLAASSNFAGGSDPTGCGSPPCLEPPDPWVAVGPNDIVQATNASIRISNRAGALRGEVSLPDFFVEPAGQSFGGDPRVLWDSLHGRWLAVEMSGDCSVGHLYLAVSDTIDPMGGWIVYRWSAGGSILDYPGLGVSSDQVVVSVNQFSTSPCSTGAYQGADAIVVDAAALVAEPTSLPWAEFGLDSSLFTWRPAEGLSAGPALPLVVGMGGGPAFDVGFARLTGTLAMKNLALSAISDLTTSAKVPPFTDPPIPAAFGAPAQNPLDGRPLDAIVQNGLLWFVAGTGCVPTGDTLARSCVRLTEVQASAAPTVVQDFVVGQSGQDVFEGGIGLTESGSLVAVWSESSATSAGPISTHASYRLPTDAPGTLRSPILVTAGVGTYAGHRWGDYVGVAQDPLDPASVWEADEVSIGSGDWTTQISQLTQAEAVTPSGSTFHPLNPTRLLDSRSGNGLSGSFASHVARTFQVTGRGGVPANASAVTGNLTVTGQTAPGYLFLGPVATANPTSSTLNFPLGDNRANGVTVALGVGGTLSATYVSASSSARTQVIFDVTGYFTPDASGSTYHALNPTRLLDTRTGNGLAGAFHANLARTFQVTGRGGVPAGATAVTGNLTVTQQTGAGYLFIGPTATNTPTSSTLNFPLGDNRANGVTVALSNTGTLSITYVSAAGRTAHVIFDVTGYFTH